MHCCFTTTPLIIITVCSVKVSRTVSRSNRVSSLKNNPELHRVNVEEAKVTKRLVAVVVGFACCWLPIFIVDNIDMAHGEPTLPRPAYLTYGFLVYLSSTINPFMYCATDKRFRREYKVVFWKIFGFKCRANNEKNDAELKWHKTWCSMEILSEVVTGKIGTSECLYTKPCWLVDWLELPKRLRKINTLHKPGSNVEDPKVRHL